MNKHTPCGLRRLMCAVSLLLCMPLAVHAGGTAAWVLAYKGKDTNQLMWDKRAQALVQTRVPAALSGRVLSALGGPPDPVEVAGGRYVSMSACRPHSCDEKGFLWIDARTGAGLGAYYLDGSLLLGSNSLSARGIPRKSIEALNAWLAVHGLQAESIKFINASGQVAPLDGAVLRPKF